MHDDGGSIGASVYTEFTTYAVSSRGAGAQRRVISCAMNGTSCNQQQVSPAQIRAQSSIINCWSENMYYSLLDIKTKFSWVEVPVVSIQ